MKIAMKITDRVVRFKLRDFVKKLAECLLPLTEYLCSNELRNDPLWGTLIPYATDSYGVGRSLGHCVRPDLILTEQGPKVCELDFVCSGRGFVLASLVGKYPFVVVGSLFERTFVWPIALPFVIGSFRLGTREIIVSNNLHIHN